MPDQNKLRERAYALWEQEGRPEGRDQDHWYRATQDLANEDETDLSGLDDGAVKPDGQPATAPATPTSPGSNAPN